MKVIFLTSLVFSLCFLGLALGVFFKRHPLQKRCAADPLEPCTCGQGEKDCVPEEKWSPAG